MIKIRKHFNTKCHKIQTTQCIIDTVGGFMAVPYHLFVWLAYDIVIDYIRGDKHHQNIYDHMVHWRKGEENLSWHREAEVNRILEKVAALCNKSQHPTCVVVHAVPTVPTVPSKQTYPKYLPDNGGPVPRYLGVWICLPSQLHRTKLTLFEIGLTRWRTHGLGRTQLSDIVRHG